MQTSKEQFSQIQDIAYKAKLNYYQSKLLHELVLKVLTYANQSYLELWAKRIKEDTAWEYADTSTRKIIYDFTLANLAESDLPEIAKHIISTLLPKS